MEKPTILLIFGGKSEEHQVSVMSASSVLESINRSKYNVSLLYITRDGKWYLLKDSSIKDLKSISSDNLDGVKVDFSSLCVDNLPKIDLALPIVHGSFCEDGRLQGIFEALGIKYVGCDSCASFTCMQKHLTKQMAKYLGIPTAKAVLVTKSSLNNPGKIIKKTEKIGYPVFVKPSSSGSSVGINMVESPKELFFAIKEALNYSPTVLIEEKISGLECEIGILQHKNKKTELSSAGALTYSNRFYDYNTKYSDNCTKYQIPAPLPKKTTDKIQKYAHSLFDFLNLRGLARIDFFVTEDQKIYFNEINTLPGFTAGSMYPMLFKHSGYSLEALIDALIDASL